MLNAALFFKKETLNVHSTIVSFSTNISKRKTRLIVIAHRADFSRLHKQKSLDCPFFPVKSRWALKALVKKLKNKKKSSIPAH